MNYSAWSLLRGALAGHRNWAPAWETREPKSKYDAIIVGGGGHGLAAAYYLAKNHGITNVAVLERGWIGGGNTGRNTTIVRSNYLYPESARLYDFSLKLYEGLSREFNFNIMLSQRGLVLLAHSRHDLDAMSRWANAMQMNGIEAEMLDARTGRRACSRRSTVAGGALADARRIHAAPRRDRAPRCGGVGLCARGLEARRRHHSELRGPRHFSSRVSAWSGSTPAAGRIRAERIGIAAAGHSSVLAQLAGFRLPVTSYALQAMVSEPIKPLLDTVVLSPGTGAYVSQSDKGEMVIGAMLDLFPSYAQRGSFAVTAIDHRRHAGAVPRVQPPAHVAPVGGHRRRRARLQPDHRPDPGSGPLHQLRMGYRRIQGHSRRRLDARARTGNRSKSPLAEPFSSSDSSGTPHRRSRRLGHRPLAHASITPAMMHITCPWCGPRDENEFVCGGTTHIVRPPLESSDRPGASTCSFATIPKGLHFERWRHAQGCGQWFNLARNTVTHEIVSIYGITEPAPR
jgi:sarcosine oxidase, subunit beta